MAPVKRLVVDVLKPHDPPLVEFTEQISNVKSVSGVTASLLELDREVQNIKLTLAGPDLDTDATEQVIEELGGTVHSVDMVSCGDVIDDSPTPQDP